MIICVNCTVGNVTYGTYSLCSTGSLATSMLTLINDITACYNSTLFPVVCIISTPNRSRTMITHLNRSTGCDLNITVRAVGITGVARLVARSLLLSYEISSSLMVVCVQFAISSSTYRARSLNLTSSFATSMFCLIKFSAASTSMEMMCAIGFPIIISVYVITGRINCSTSCNLGVAS